MEIKSKKDISDIKISISEYIKPHGGVYFLIQDEEIVYVGKTNYLTQRLLAHQSDPKKQFNFISFLPIDDSEERGAIEAFYIYTFSPKYNKQVPDLRYKNKLLKLFIQDKISKQNG